MTLDELRSELKHKGIIVKNSGGQLAVDAPIGALTEGLRLALVEHKQELIAYLGESSFMPSLRIIITWPAWAPAAVMPANWSQLPDGRLQAVYMDEDELRESVHTLAMLKQALDFGGVVREC